MPGGPQLTTVQVPGFVIRLGVHPGGSEIAPHYHDDPTICYVLRGGFTEYCHGEAADCAAATLKVMPAGEPHSNRFGEAETRGLRIEVDRNRFAEVPAIYRVLEERWHLSGGRSAELAHRMAAELTAADTAGPIAAEGLALELLVELARIRLDRPERRIELRAVDIDSQQPLWSQPEPSAVRPALPARPAGPTAARWCRGSGCRTAGGRSPAGSRAHRPASAGTAWACPPRPARGGRPSGAPSAADPAGWGCLPSPSSSPAARCR